VYSAKKIFWYFNPTAIAVVPSANVVIKGFDFIIFSQMIEFYAQSVSSAKKVQKIQTPCSPR